MRFAYDNHEIKANYDPEKSDLFSLGLTILKAAKPKLQNSDLKLMNDIGKGQRFIKMVV